MDEFELAEVPSENSQSAFVVDLDGFEGPIDVLLTLAREQKVDITQISIVQLADQYLEFVAVARRTSLELAADYLVMAAWLAYLKSRLLLPDLSEEGEPTGEEMAAALAFQLKRLEAMQETGARMMARSRLGQDYFARGAPEKFAVSQNTVFDVTLFDLLKCYGEQSRRKAGTTLHIEAWDIYSVDDALDRLHALVGKTPDWKTLSGFLPTGIKDGLGLRSAIASTFAASLEMAREGKLRLRQNDTFGQIYIRSSVDDVDNRPKPETDPGNDDR
ncbi:MAG: segregation and condensation protein A [Alphaproteobacteria bacterium]